MPPYITNEDRAYVKARGPKTAGELNYAITMLVQGYLGEEPNYQLFNDAIGALEGAKLELYRRQVVPYEDVKIEENGDLFPEDLDLTIEELRDFIGEVSLETEMRARYVSTHLGIPLDELLRREVHDREGK